MDASALMAALLPHRPELLRFVRRRVRDDATAEDILQDALMKSVARVGELREADALLGWFYRVLENAVADHHRRASTAVRGLQSLGAQTEGAVVEADDAPARACRCVAKVKAELPPDQARALERIEVDELAVKDFAVEEGITASNAGVRIFRARQALKRKVEQTCGHCAKAGCKDCSCVQ